ncbi:hypothetical protein FKM82_002399 [Ascaphus truei]
MLSVGEAFMTGVIDNGTVTDSPLYCHPVGVGMCDGVGGCEEDGLTSSDIDRFLMDNELSSCGSKNSACHIHALSLGHCYCHFAPTWE